MLPVVCVGVAPQHISTVSGPRDSEMKLLINRFRLPEIRQAARLEWNSEAWGRSHSSFWGLEFGAAPSWWGKVATTVGRRRAAGRPPSPELLQPGPNTTCPGLCCVCGGGGGISDPHTHWKETSHGCTLTHLQWCIQGSPGVSDTLAVATQPGWSSPSSFPQICPFQPHSGFFCSFACQLTSTEVCPQPRKVKKEGFSPSWSL